MHVLLLDDDTDFLAAASDALEMLGHRVTALADARMALERLGGTPAIDVLIVDRLLGEGLSGSDVARQAHLGTPDLPVILLTGDPTQDGEEAMKVVPKTDGIYALKSALERIAEKLRPE